MPNDLRDRIKSRISAAKTTKPSTPKPIGPPVTDPSSRLRGAVDRAKERISTLPKTPQAAGAAGMDYLRTTAVPQLAQAGQNRFPNVPISQGTPVNLTPPTANPDRGLIITWIKQQPAFQWLQTVLSQYGIDLGEIAPRTSPGGLGAEGTPGSTPFGVTDTGSMTGSVGGPPTLPNQNGEMISNPYAGPTNPSGFYNPGF